MFQRRLGAMEREGQVMRNRKGATSCRNGPASSPARSRATPTATASSFPTTAAPTSSSTSIRWARCCTATAPSCASPASTARGRPEGSIVEVTARANTRVVGRVFVEHGVVFVVPENRRIAQDILVPPEKKGKIKPVAGQVVMVDIIEQPSKFSQPIGRITEVLGTYADPGMEIEIALRKHDLPFAFSPAALAENKAMPDKVKKADLADREDIRHLPW